MSIAERTPIYSLNSSYFLWNDVEFILKKIEQYYGFVEGSRNLQVASKIRLNSTNAYSEEARTQFNQLVPEIKSLHKDMFHLVEGIVKAASNDHFDVPALENKYTLFKCFRLFGNKIKHHNSKEIEVTFATISTGGTLIGNTMYMEKITVDVMCNFKSENQYILFARFIELFYTILVEYKIITIKQ